ncbi:hypothetical protein CHARACLAT_016779 [Characodon lateralis]|uniref:Uncharacterized protein n=1 Tax=Characodon lateralis TaxID=208331 RepID=A0ABU7F4P4_9TELE|nr:hypothetical protein [Characodon lateralis]
MLRLLLLLPGNNCTNRHCYSAGKPVIPETSGAQDPEAGARPSPSARCFHSSEASRPKCDVTGEPLLKQTGI